MSDNTRPRTPPSLPSQRGVYQHHPTPTRAAIRNIVQFNDLHDISYHKTDLWRYFDIAPRSGYEILREEAESRRYHNNPSHNDKRGWKTLISPYYICEMERILQEEGIEGWALTWAQLGYEVGLECSYRTIQRTMGSMDYRKCIACQKGWVSDKSAKKRVEWCQRMLESYRTSQSWYRVRFSDEVHYGYEVQDPLHIIQKPGERYCPDYIQREEGPKETEKKKVHAWAAAGYGFKSAIHFYNIHSNINGKMTLQDYWDQILEPIVKPWIQEGQDFVLEEDGDSGHNLSKSNIVRKWKELNDLKSYFNSAGSPDLSSIENCWQPTKDKLRKYPHWDDKTTKSLVSDAWKQKVNQDFINRRVRSVPRRLKDVIKTDRQFAAQKWIEDNVDSDTDYWTLSE